MTGRGLFFSFFFFFAVVVLNYRERKHRTFKVTVMAPPGIDTVDCNVNCYRSAPGDSLGL